MHMCQGHMSNTRSVSAKEREMGMGLRIKHAITQPWTHRFLFSHKVFLLTSKQNLRHKTVSNLHKVAS